jgi:hypothetical protein
MGFLAAEAITIVVRKSNGSVIWNCGKFDGGADRGKKLGLGSKS